MKKEFRRTTNTPQKYDNTKMILDTRTTSAIL
jgi:hypothetical protein